MAIDFRTAVFHLCKKCAKNKTAIEIRELIHSISTAKGHSEDSSQSILEPSHGDLAYISSQKRIQFLGYLLTDESVESINQIPMFHATHLDKNERNLIEIAHLSINFFIQSCIEEIVQKYPKASILINPYSNYREPKICTAAGSFLTDLDIEECVTAFKSSKIYRKIIENDTLCFLHQASEEAIRALNATLDKQLRSDYSTISDETKQMIQLVDSGSISIRELAVVYNVYCYALQKSLENAAQMLFEAMMGENLIVLDNENIINVYEEQKDLVYERYTVLCQDIFLDHSFSSLESIVLLNCEMAEDYLIKKFGKVFSQTLSLDQEFGPSTKISFVTVDEELNTIHSLTDYLIKSKIGQIRVVSKESTPQTI